MMGDLYELTRSAQNNNKDALLLIIQRFSPKIKKSLFHTTYQDQGDLEQELKLKIIKAILEYDLESTPNFREFKYIIEQLNGANT
jgi:hypothetical protein